MLVPIAFVICLLIFTDLFISIRIDFLWHFHKPTIPRRIVEGLIVEIVGGLIVLLVAHYLLAW